jgi:hypothetical protein
MGGVSAWFCAQIGDSAAMRQIRKDQILRIQRVHTFLDQLKHHLDNLDGFIAFLESPYVGEAEVSPQVDANRPEMRGR